VRGRGGAGRGGVEESQRVDYMHAAFEPRPERGGVKWTRWWCEGDEAREGGARTTRHEKKVRGRRGTGCEDDEA